MKILYYIVIALILSLSACKVKDVPPDVTDTTQVYSNAAFKDVTVEKLDSNRYVIEGKGRIFEASFSWVVEDGHEELQQGYEMTSGGAPEWGTFKFTIEAHKKRENSTLTLILFESSAKDGHRMHELPIVLE